MRSTDRNAHSRTSSRFTRRTRSGFTLLEVLVATAVTLLMMVALAKIFSDIGRSMKQGRAALELNGRLRDVTYRLQTALNNATANPNSRPGTVEGRGYMELYDGSTTEHTAQQLVGPQVNRFGDVDDISMFTARAGDVWFTGKVPRFILERRAPVNTDSNGNGRIDDYESESLISVGSQHAEIVAFMQPVVAGEKAVFAGVLNPQRDSRYLVGSPAFYQDNDGNGLPDAWRLHYRTLIIRPDLNLADGALPFNSSNGYFMVGPQFVTLPDGSRAPLPTPNCDMASVHGVCDLSMRRVFDGNNSTRDRVAANSLQDLENPANRFAHVQLPIPNTSSTTMPVLALTPSLPVHASDPVRFDFTEPSPFVSGNGLLGSGFLHPAFSLHSYIYDTQEIGERVGEDILANDVLAFDIKVYDPGVPILASFGVDGAPGVVGEDDDGNGVVDSNGSVYDPAEIGWAGSDDLVLSPNDPGYGFAIAAGAATVGAGEYLDIGWANKLDNHLRILDPSSGVTAAMNVWSPMSGYSFNNFVGNPTPRITSPPFRTVFTHSLLLSGKALVVGGSPVLCQHSYDTWTDIFERDGFQQVVQTNNAQIIGGRRLNGAIDLYGLSASGNELGRAMLPWRQGNIDPAIDGLDNDGSSGADDQQEFETSPPFDVPLRGIKISVRMENPGAREVRELPVSVEFVSH